MTVLWYEQSACKGQTCKNNYNTSDSPLRQLELENGRLRMMIAELSSRIKGYAGSCRNDSLLADLDEYWTGQCIETQLAYSAAAIHLGEKSPARQLELGLPAARSKTISAVRNWTPTMRSTRYHPHPS